MLADLTLNEGNLEGLIVCLIVACLLGAIVWAIGHYAFHQAWAGVAGFVTFILVLLLCIL